MTEAVEKQMRAMIEAINDKEVSALYAKLPAGKRLRAKLLFSIAQKEPAAPKLAAIIELIHAASLLHDDVIDEASQRRGVTSVNAAYGNKHAIMLGDVLYSKAYFELAAFDTRIAQTVSDAVTKLSVGELQDVELAKTFNTDAKAYEQMIYNKTAVLIEATARCGALLAKKEEDVYAKYGRNLGLAFQIVDDILDITQDSQTLGKPALNDFVEGKTTLPYIYLYQKLDQQGRQKLQSMHGRELDKAEQNRIKEQMHEFGCIQKAYRKAKILADEATALMHARGEQYLVSIATAMVDRKF